MMTAFKLETPRDVAIHTQTLIALAYEARAERNQVALAFIGERIKPLMPEASLAAFKEDLKRVPAKPVAQEPLPMGASTVAELEEHIRKRDAAKLDVVKAAVASAMPAVAQVLRDDAKGADIDF